MKYNRFKLEECITSLYQISEDIKAMMHKEFDTEEGLTEDGKMNILIGMMELHKVRCDATCLTVGKFLPEYARPSSLHLFLT